LSSGLSDKGKSSFRDVLIRTLHLATLWTVAVAQPLLDLLSHNPEFFIAHKATPFGVALFALIVVFIPILAVFCVEIVAELISASLGRVVHLVLTTLITVVLLAYVTRKVGLDNVAMVSATLVGTATALVFYIKYQGVKSFLTVLSPVTVVAVVLFVFFSPATKIIFPQESGSAATKEKVDAPIVFIVFDEFPVVSLLNREGEIDGKRFPNFKALADTSTWYEHTVAAGQSTVDAVPAILSGKYPGKNKIPTLQDYPNNLFTLFQNSHAPQIKEALTNLCPKEMCEEPADSDSSSWSSIQSMIRDAKVVSAHTVLPTVAASHLPSVSTQWTNFGSSRDSEAINTSSLSQVNRTELPGALLDYKNSERSAATKRAEESGKELPGFDTDPDGSGKPMLFFIHHLLPHGPYNRYPSGSGYNGDSRDSFYGWDPKKGWSSDAEVAKKSQQRHILQVAAIDVILGQRIKKLKQRKQFDDALIVVVADHGISFRPGGNRRNLGHSVEKGNSYQSEVGLVPLIIKAPHQRRGRVYHNLISNIDILPIVAHELKVRLPWKVDGSVPSKSNQRKKFPIRGVLGDQVLIDGQSVLKEHAESLKRQVGLFGDGSISNVYKIGPEPQIIGKKISALTSSEDLFHTGVLSLSSPANGVVKPPESLVVGSVKPIDDKEVTQLAIGINGQIVATTYTDQFAKGADGTVNFSALLPEEAVQTVNNKLSIYRINKDSSTVKLDLLGQFYEDYLLTGHGKSLSMKEVNNGTSVATVTTKGSKGLDGYVDNVTADKASGTTVISGWAGDKENHKLVDGVYIFVDGKFLLRTTTGISRPDVVSIIGDQGLQQSGFSVTVPSDVLKNKGKSGVQVFARVGNAFSELQYTEGYPLAGKKSK